MNDATFSLPNIDNHFLALGDDFYSRVRPQSLSNTHLIHANEDLAKALGINSQQLQSQGFVRAFSGLQSPDSFAPLAMAYSGHQFGTYNPQLGDGRGLLLTQVRDRDNRSWDIHLKGAGRTPYSRFGDGRAVLRSSIREYLGSEALYHLGIPTTRALALFGSNTPVQRETEENAALLVRAAESHVRFGSFEWFHYTRRPELVKVLADYVINLHHADLPKDDTRYAIFLQRVVKQTAELICHWQSVGFTHGVMNTDNMSIIGDTFDYGPYGFMDDYSPSFVCNLSDTEGRYAFDQQPGIGLWNLNALAHALSSLISSEDINTALNLYEPHIRNCFVTKMCAKLGLSQHNSEDAVLATQWLSLLEKNHVDYTISFRALGEFQWESNETDKQTFNLRDQFVDRDGFDAWMQTYRQRLTQESQPEADRIESMKKHNPKFILRNHLAQHAIELAEQGDYSEIDTLLSVLKKPFDEQTQFDHYAAAPAQSAKGRALSCSS